MKSAIAALALLVVLPLLAAEEESAAPALSIVSRLGKDADVKLFDDEEVEFFARLAGDSSSPLLRGVTFTLFDEGGSPARGETVRVRQEDGKRWGRPPSSFLYPLSGRPLPIGPYRLRAEKKGHRPAEIRFVVASFVYFDLKTEHTKEQYRAALSLRLADLTERRKTVDVEARIETADGNLLDETRVRLFPVSLRTHTYESRTRLKLSSRLEGADRDRPKGQRTGVLRVVPGAFLVLVLDDARFVYEIPLPPEKKKSGTSLLEERSSNKRGGSGGRGR